MKTRRDADGQSDFAPTVRYRRDDRDYFRNPYRRSPFRRRSIVALAALGIFLLLLISDGLYVANGMRDALGRADDELKRGRAAIESGEITEARSAFTEASQATRRAQELAGHPSYVLAGLIPLAGIDVHAINSLTDAAQSIADAGLVAVEAGETLGGTTSEELASAFYRDGRVQLEAIQAAQEYVSDARAELLEARASLRDAGDPLSGTVQEALDEAMTDVAAALDVTDRGTTLLSALPPLFGEDGPRRYLLAFQTPSQARGTGGIIGLYGVLEARDGRVALTHIGPFIELFTNLDRGEITNIAAAEEFLRNYNRAVEVSANINRSPDFPSVAGRLLRIYERSTGRRLHGVLATDPVALADLLRATGPITADGFDITLEPENAADILLHDTYLMFDERPEAQSRFLTSLIRNFYKAFGGKGIDGPALVSALGSSSASRHLMMFSRFDDEQAGLRRLGVAGSLEVADSNVQHVYHNNLGDNKVDFFMDRQISTTVQLNRAGDASIRTEIEVTNNAPRDREQAITESYTNTVPDGMNFMSLNVLIPTDAEQVRWTADGRSIRAASGTEAGLPATWVNVKVAAGQTKRLVVNYEIPQATQLLRGGNFSFALIPQPTVRPTTYSVEIVPPVGFDALSDTPETQTNGGSITMNGELTKTIVLDVRIEPKSV